MGRQRDTYGGDDCRHDSFQREEYGAWPSGQMYWSFSSSHSNAARDHVPSGRPVLSITGMNGMIPRVLTSQPRFPLEPQAVSAASQQAGVHGEALPRDQILLQAALDGRLEQLTQTCRADTADGRPGAAAARTGSPSRSRPPASARSARDRSRAGPCGRATMFTGIGLKTFVTPPVAHDPSSRSAISARRVGSTIVTAR
jgi:hypothetical protein